MSKIDDAYRAALRATKRQRLAARQSRSSKVEALVRRIREAKIVNLVRLRYDGSLGNADSDAPEGSEKHQWDQHDHAIEAVHNLLDEHKLLADGDEEPGIVDEAFAEIA